ncbi:MAG: S9 family peptidase [Candidatus Eisenbacteria bacterium]|uniref:S9 family peptidase n=1 Tax=Eiseniibacteriota bacterium TaxID=2212470 RepID=A0A849SI95_UNCEI|nr:S9 family peptidase [Candidatus Eisenbacteria bacterium]
MRANAISLEQALTISSFSGLTWSPDGSTLAYVVTSVDSAESTSNADLWLYDFTRHREWQLTRHPKNDVSPTFSATGDTIAFIANRGSGEDARSAIWMLSLSGGDPWAVGTYDEAVTEVQWSPDGRTLAYVKLDTLPRTVREWRKQKWDHLVEDEILQWPQIWTLDLATGKQRRLTTDATGKWYLRWAPDGTALAWITSPTGRPDEENQQDLAVVAARGGPVRRLGVIGTAFTWSPDARWIALATGTDRAQWVQKRELVVVPSGGGAARILTAQFDEDATLPAWNATRDTLSFHSAQGVTTRMARVALAGGAVTLGTDVNGTATALTSAPNGRAAWIQSGPEEPGEIVVAAHADRAGSPLTARNAALATRTFGSMRTVRWTSSDGVRVEGLLLRPAGAAARGALRTAVVLHGGPYSTRFDLGFQAIPQWFAANGWQVFMPNFRSSGGYGTAFMRRERADWGGQDHRDVTSGVDHLVAQGLVDSSRLAVFGRSYGGYLTAWTITQTSRFDAACVIAGISDLRLQWGVSDVHRYREYEQQGPPWEREAIYRDRSPIQQVRKVRTPTLILVGANDPRTPPANSELLYTSLRRLEVPTELVRYPRELHSPREYRHQWDQWTRIRAWFDRWVR